jgi:hypothetical protein
VPLSARALLEEKPADFAYEYAKADAKTVRSLRKQLATSKSAFAVFLRALGSAHVEHVWPRAMQAITHFTTPYTLHYKKKWLAQLAEDRQLVEAIQAAAVGGRNVPAEMIAVLAIEGSEASADAVMPYFAAAIETKDERLDALHAFRRLRLKSPVMLAMLEGAGARRDARIAESPALTFAASIGLPRVPGYHFRVTVDSSSNSPGQSPPGIAVSLTVDSRELNWFNCDVSRVVDLATTSFDSESLFLDSFGIGSAPPSEWPEWLARVAKKLGVQWSPEVFISSSFRGAKRDHIVQWLKQG